MKQSNTGKSSFAHNDTIYEFWYDNRMEMVDDNYENLDIDTIKAREIFSQSVIAFLNNSFNLSLSYDGLYMAKCYNYEGDKINFSYNDNDFDLLLNALKDYELSNYLEYNIEQYTTSYPGYVAYYNEDELKADKDLFIRVILETLFNNDYVQNEYEQYYNRNCIYDKLENSVIIEGQ